MEAAENGSFFNQQGNKHLDWESKSWLESHRQDSKFICQEMHYSAN